MCSAFDLLKEESKSVVVLHPLYPEDQLPVNTLEAGDEGVEVGGEGLVVHAHLTRGINFGKEERGAIWSHQGR